MIHTTPEGEGVLTPPLEAFRSRSDRWGKACPSFLDPEGPRGTAHRIGEAVLAWALPGPDRWTAARCVEALKPLTARLTVLQHPDGTIDSDNIHSPPDTGFVLESLESVLLIAGKASPPADLAAALEPVRNFCDRGARMLVHAGIHTPNHRWLVVGVLAHAFRRTGEEAFRVRALDWLGEGIDLDADGQYSERSAGIYTAVTNHSLIRAYEGLGAPELLEPVRRSLEALLLLLQPNGEIETVASRRQDQAMVFSPERHFFPFWYMACHDANPRFAAGARLAARGGEEASWQLPDVAAFAPPGGSGVWNFPPETALPSRFTQAFGMSGLIRHRNGALAVSVFGGSDLARSAEYPDLSGISTNPTLLTIHQGGAACRWLRIRPQFFDLTSIRPRLESFDGRRAVLVWSREVPYFQPLPTEKRNPEGDYALTTGDRRFWSCLDFPSRSWSERSRLEFRVIVDLRGDGCDVLIQADANARVNYSVELAFDADEQIAASGNSLICRRLGDGLRVTAQGAGAWKNVSALPPGEPGRHSSLKGGETKPQTLNRQAMKLEAPGEARFEFRGETHA